MKRQSSSLIKELPPRKKMVNLNRGRDDRPLAFEVMSSERSRLGRPIDSFTVRGSKIAIGRWGPSPIPRFKREHSTAAGPSPRAESRPRTRLGRLCGLLVFEVTRSRMSASRECGMRIASRLVRRSNDLRSKYLHQQAAALNKTQGLT